MLHLPVYYLLKYRLVDLQVDQIDPLLVGLSNQRDRFRLLGGSKSKRRRSSGLWPFTIYHVVLHTQFLQRLGFVLLHGCNAVLFSVHIVMLADFHQRVRVGWYLAIDVPAFAAAAAFGCCPKAELGALPKTLVVVGAAWPKVPNPPALVEAVCCPKSEVAGCVAAWPKPPKPAGFTAAPKAEVAVG